MVPQLSMYGLGTYDLLDWCQRQSHTFGDVMGEERVKAQVSRRCHAGASYLTIQ